MNLDKQYSKVLVGPELLDREEKWGGINHSPEDKYCYDHLLNVDDHTCELPLRCQRPLQSWSVALLTLL